MNWEYEDIGEISLIDEETTLYQAVVFKELMTHGSAPQILPVGLLLFELTGTSLHPFTAESAKMFADALLEISGENATAARVEERIFAVLLAHVNEAEVYSFAEQLAGLMRKLSLFDKMKVSVIFKHWKSVIQEATVFYREGLQELKTGKGLRLKFIAEQEQQEKAL